MEQTRTALAQLQTLEKKSIFKVGVCFADLAQTAKTHVKVFNHRQNRRETSGKIGKSLVREYIRELHCEKIRKLTTIHWKICFRLAVVNLQQNVVSFSTSQ